MFYTPPMSDRMIYILSGPIQIGKTTALVKWSAGRSDVFGILTPVVNGKRFFMDAHAQNQFEMESNDIEQEVVSIGGFKFSREAFERASHIIDHAINKGWLVIDEIGPLELNKEGFYEILRKALENHTHQLLIVVRESLLPRVTEFFQVKSYDVISKEGLMQL
jgi:nucleoside-triphosphatase THEP1